MTWDVAQTMTSNKTF